MTNALLLLAALAYQAGAAPSVPAEPMSVVATGAAALDTANCQAALDTCAATGRPVVFDATAKPFVISQTLVLRPAPGRSSTTGLRVTACNKTDGSPTFWYTGDGACFKTLGIKSSSVENVRVQLRGKAGVGFWLASDQTAQSTSGVILRLCSVLGVGAGQLAGFWVGPADDNRLLGDGSNDVSNLTLERCSASNVATGYHIWGRNTKSILLTGDMASTCSGPAFLFDAQPFHPHCFTQGSVLTGCDVSGVSCFLKSGADGNEITVVGGRGENLSAGYAIWTTAGGGPGYVKVLGFKDDGAKGVRAKVDGQQPVVVL